MLTSILVALIMGASYVLRDVLVGRKTASKTEELTKAVKQAASSSALAAVHASQASELAGGAASSSRAAAGALHVYHEALKPALAQLPKTRKRKVAAGIGEPDREAEA